MQRSHRVRHRMVWVVLTPLAFAALAWALWYRVEMPVMEEVPGVVIEEEGE